MNLTHLPILNGPCLGCVVIVTLVPSSSSSSSPDTAAAAMAGGGEHQSSSSDGLSINNLPIITSKTVPISSSSFIIIIISWVATHRDVLVTFSRKIMRAHVGRKRMVCVLRKVLLKKAARTSHMLPTFIGHALCDDLLPLCKLYHCVRSRSSSGNQLLLYHGLEVASYN